MVLQSKPPRQGRSYTPEILEDVSKEPLMRLNMCLPQSLHRRLKIHVAQRGTSITHVLIKLIEDHLSKES